MLEREFYTLDVLAQRWNCTVDDLIHLGFKGEAQICWFLDGWPSCPSRPWPVANTATFYSMSPAEITETLALDIARTTKPMPPWSFVVPKSALLSLVLPGRDITPKVGGFFRFDATSEFVDGGWNWYLFYEPVAINRNQLCILAEEFARLSHEVFAESSATPPSEDLTLQPGLRQTTQEVSADPIAEPPDQELRSGALLTCWIPCDHVPARSWPLFKARDVLRGVIESLRQEAVA